MIKELKHFHQHLLYDSKNQPIKAQIDTFGTRAPKFGSESGLLWIRHKYA